MYHHIWMKVYLNFWKEQSILCLLFLSTINQNVNWKYFWHMGWIFFLVFITKNINIDTILFFNFVNISNFNGKFYVLKINFSYKIFTNFSNTFWSMLWMVYISDQTPFKVFIIINTLNINKTFFIWLNSFGNLI